MRNEVGQRDKAQEKAHAHAKQEAADAADDGDDRGFNEELTADVHGGSAPRALRTPISRVRSATATSMMFMTPMPPRARVRRATAPKKKKVMTPRCALSELRALKGIPDPESLLVVGAVVVAFGDDALHLVEGLLVELGRDRLDDDVVHVAAYDSGRSGGGSRGPWPSRW